jgi:hypothetical protein
MKMPPDDLIRQAYTAFNTRDIEAALATMSPNVIWPNALSGGTIYGREGVRDYWTRLWQVADPAVEPISILREPNGAYAAEVRQIVRDLNGAVMIDRIVRQTYRMHEGLIQSMNVSG